MTVNALDIWRKLADAEICLEASEFYKNRGINKETILNHGSTNFDEKVTGSDDEKAWYKSAYYMAHNGYMDMHIKHNKASCLAYLNDLNKNDEVLFVDFGCGPMTAGIVFAQLMSQKRNDYKAYSHYVGIDVSKNMCAFATSVNSKLELFVPSQFRIQNSDTFDPNGTIAPTSIVIVSFSFVLSPETLKTTQDNFAKKLAANWHKFFEQNQTIREIRFIYHNPKVGAYHTNWQLFTNALQQLGNSAEIQYNVGAIEDCEWGGSKPSAMAMIKGTRKAES